MTTAQRIQIAERQMIAFAVLAAVFALAWLAAVLPPAAVQGTRTGHQFAISSPDIHEQVRPVLQGAGSRQ